MTYTRNAAKTIHRWKCIITHMFMVLVTTISMCIEGVKRTAQNMHSENKKNTSHQTTNWILSHSIRYIMLFLNAARIPYYTKYNEFALLCTLFGSLSISHVYILQRSARCIACSIYFLWNAIIISYVCWWSKRFTFAHTYTETRHPFGAE